VQELTPISEHRISVPRCVSWRSAGVAACPDLPQSGWNGPRCIALCMVLGLVALIAASGPHSVHHLLEQQHTDCLVLSLTQSTPLAECVLCLLPDPLPSGDQPVPDGSLCTLKDPRCIAQPRAPPT